MTSIERFVVFAVACLIISFLANIGLGALAAAHGEASRLLRQTSVGVPYAVAVVLCGALGMAMGIWTRKSFATNVLASLVCFAAPFAVTFAGASVLCLRWWECLR